MLRYIGVIMSEVLSGTLLNPEKRIFSIYYSLENKPIYFSEIESQNRSHFVRGPAHYFDRAEWWMGGVMSEEKG